MEKDASLDFAELETLFLQVSKVVNSRPLTARVSEDDRWFPIAPVDLLHGRATGLEERIEHLRDQEWEVPDITLRHQEIKRMEAAWWSRWIEDGFPLMCPYKRWTSSHRNLEVGDLVMIKYDKALGPDKYRLGKVAEVYPDDQGRVRTVLVTTRDRRRGARERNDVCKAGVVSMRLAVQRVVVLLPAGETWEGGLPCQEQS